MDNLSDPLVTGTFADPLTTDTALLRAAAAGSRQAFALVVRRYQNAAYSWAVHALGDPERAESFCEDLFDRARRRAGDAPPDVAHWLLGLAIDLGREVGLDGDKADRDIDALWIGGLVEEALAHLDPADRELLMNPQLALDDTDRRRITQALERLGALLAARGILRRERGHD